MLETFEASEAFHELAEEMFGEELGEDQDEEDAWDSEDEFEDQSIWEDSVVIESEEEDYVESADEDAEREGEESRRQGETPSLNSSAVSGEEMSELAGKCESKVEAQGELTAQGEVDNNTRRYETAHPSRGQLLREVAHRAIRPRRAQRSKGEKRLPSKGGRIRTWKKRWPSRW